MMLGRTMAAMVLAVVLWSGSALAATPLKVVASFSILGDMVANVGGDRIEVITLVGPDGDAHVYEPSPADAKKVSSADLVVVNGLGFEGWLERLVKASGYKGKIVVASEGVKPRAMEEESHEHDHAEIETKEHHTAKGHDHEHGHADAHHHGHDHGDVDPHAWHNLANAKIYVKNIAKGLAEVDPANAGGYQQAEAAYLGELDTLETWVKAQLTQIPQQKRRMITSHDALGYFGEAYGVKILSPMGVSTASEPSAGGVKKLIRQINQEKITAVFVENISDRRLVEQIAKESKVSVEGELYSDALSKHDGPASTYIKMVRANVDTIVAAMKRGLQPDR